MIVWVIWISGKSSDLLVIRMTWVYSIHCLSLSHTLFFSSKMFSLRFRVWCGIQRNSGRLFQIKSDMVKINWRPYVNNASNDNNMPIKHLRFLLRVLYKKKNWLVSDYSSFSKLRSFTKQVKLNYVDMWKDLNNSKYCTHFHTCTLDFPDRGPRPKFGSLTDFLWAL